MPVNGASGSAKMKGETLNADYSSEHNWINYQEVNPFFIDY